MIIFLVSDCLSSQPIISKYKPTNNAPYEYSLNPFQRYNGLKDDLDIYQPPAPQRFQIKGYNSYFPYSSSIQNYDLNDDSDLNGFNPSGLYPNSLDSNQVTINNNNQNGIHLTNINSGRNLNHRNPNDINPTGLNLNDAYGDYPGPLYLPPSYFNPTTESLSTTTITTMATVTKTISLNEPLVTSVILHSTTTLMQPPKTTTISLSPRELISQGAAISCYDIDQSPGNFNWIQTGVFRFMDNQLHLYPNQDIAASWDPVWAHNVRIDCTLYPKGPPMSLRLPCWHQDMALNQTRCSSDPEKW
jgi:hypothetical protein